LVNNLVKYGCNPSPAVLLTELLGQKACIHAWLCVLYNASVFLQQAQNVSQTLHFYCSYTVKMNMLYLIKKIVATDYKQYY